MVVVRLVGICGRYGGHVGAVVVAVGNAGRWWVGGQAVGNGGHVW